MHIDDLPEKNKLGQRMRLLLLLASVLSAAYAATWCGGSTSQVAVVLGQHANNIAMLMAFLPLMLFLALMFPEDLDSADARKYIGPMLAMSNVSGTLVFISVTWAYATDRSEGASQSFEQRACLYIHYGICCFFFYWGVLYPTACFYHIGGRANSWRTLRRGLVIDSSAFFLAIFLLWWFGEERFPPGDAPLHVALCGRPTIGLLTAAVFSQKTRQEMVRWCSAAGLYHVNLSLHELRRDEIRAVLRRSGFGEPVASGNVDSATTRSSFKSKERHEDSEADSSTEPSVTGVPRRVHSHHTAKLGGDVAPYRRKLG